MLISGARAAQKYGGSATLESIITGNKDSRVERVFAGWPVGGWPAERAVLSPVGPGIAEVGQAQGLEPAAGLLHNSHPRLNVDNVGVGVPIGELNTWNPNLQ